MRNAIVYDERITVGHVPTTGDMQQLRDFSYRTVVDLRSEDEKLGRYVEHLSGTYGIRCVSIPITRTRITHAKVARFYEAVYLKLASPIYAFSRYGRRPLAFLVLFDVIARGEPAVRVFEKGARYGMSLESDLYLQLFLAKASRDEAFRATVSSIREQIDALPGVL
jgi:protein tyrosine phosphatase (PTP) superfamily phosphohydrolase (DUF442 family)